MKKAITILLAALMLLTLFAACAEKKDAASNNSQAANPAENGQPAAPTANPAPTAAPIAVPDPLEELYGMWTLTGIADNEELNAMLQQQLGTEMWMTITLNEDKTAVLYEKSGSKEDTLNCTFTAENGELTLNPPAEYAYDVPQVMRYRIENGKLYLTQGDSSFTMTMIFEKK